MTNGTWKRTTRHADCARCEEAAQCAEDWARERDLTETKHHIESGTTKHWGRAVYTVPDPKPFTFKFDAITGVYMAAALREKAEAELAEADEKETLAFGGGPLTDMYDVQAMHARNRAKLLEDAAKDIHSMVHNRLVEDFTKAIPLEG